MAKTGLIYGPTDTYKTTAVAHFAQYIAKVTDKATLLLSADGGGWVSCEPQVKAGMVIPWRLETDMIPLPLLRKASQGYMPVDPAEMEASRIVMRPIPWDEIGGIAVEGWTSIGRVVMRYLPDKNVNVGGEDRSKLGSFSVPVYMAGQNGGPATISSERFSSNTRGDYGFVQNMLSGLVMNWSSLPCHYVLFTALEAKGRDEDGTTIYGPGIPGKAVINDSPQWVGDCIHAQDYPVMRKVLVPNPANPSEKVEQEVMDKVVRYYYTSHPDPQTGIIFKAKPRCVPTQVPALRREMPGGYFEPGLEHGFDTYLHLLDKLSAEAGEDTSLKEWREAQDKKRRARQSTSTSTPTSVVQPTGTTADGK